ncbi:hypothetical protein CDN99_24125 [Roseateles aquatilis]|uniref:DUF3325 domain-containing protein n=1 Tax=Roseateles aquatilis TaxID=431061 RepID=A0A246IW39_9BURK|nr:hypothetical protein [Roseateles aquatilis]OWQ84386.1 hypothetical protein CDN99_24125 [Roseateles aquatilis]
MILSAALLFVLASTVVAAFQAALVLGMPWGELTCGGKWRGRLPRRVRIIPLLSMLLLGLSSLVILTRAQWMWPELHAASRVGAWAVVGYCALSCVANAATPSRRERQLWLPVVICMLVASLVVALA